MSCLFVLMSWLAAGAQAFAPAPIQWALGAKVGKNFIVSPEGLASGTFPVPLSIMDQPGRVAFNRVPYFTARPDSTITWDAEGLCVEAAGKDVGAAILVNHCTGKQNQRWELMPWRGGRGTEIHLKGTQNCINVDERERILNGAPVILAKCGDEVTEIWEVPRLIPIAAQRATPSSSLRQVTISAMVLSVLGVLGLGAILRRQRLALVEPISPGGVPLNVDRGGISLRGASLMRKDIIDCIASGDHVNMQETVPAVMGLSVKMSADDDDADSAAVGDLFLSSDFVTPIGPLCPFRSRSSSAKPLNDEMGTLTQEMMPRFALEMSRIQLEISAGGQPDKARVGKMAEDLTQAAQKWETVNTRMRLTEDFQLREFYKVGDAFAQSRGEIIDSVGIMMRWQADNMRAYANDQQPIPPPPGLNLEQKPGNTGNPTQVFGSKTVDAMPFKETAFESEVVKKEYDQLCRDHRNIIELGEQYGTFDPIGKIAFLDSLKAIEERWDVFFTRFALMGSLNPEFTQQISAYLESMAMAPTDLRKIVREAHELMRKDAEDERLR